MFNPQKTQQIKTFDKTMKEKVFATLFRLISSGQLTVEEAYYLMETLFKEKDKDSNDNSFGTIHQVQPYTVADPGLHPWWESNTITASPNLVTCSTTEPSGCINATYTALAATDPNVVTTATSACTDTIPTSNLTISSNGTGLITADPEPISLGGDSDTSHQAMSLEDLDELLR